MVLRIFSVFLFLTLFVFPKTVFAAPGTDTMVGYWKFDETVQGSDAVDSSGDGKVGSPFGLGGGPNPSTSIPLLNFPNNRSLSFDGNNDYVDLPDGFANFSSGLTISVWARPTATSNWGRFVDLGNGDASDNIIFGRNSTSAGLYFEVYDGDETDKVTANSSIENNEWHQYAVTLTAGGAVTLYKDGVALETGTTNVPNNIVRTKNYIGRSNWAADDFYQGQMDDLRIYSRVLSASEIFALASGTHTTATWDGPESSSYETGDNWDIQSVPDPYTNVVVKPAIFQPVLTRSISLASLTVNSGAKFTAGCHTVNYNDNGSLVSNGTYIGCGTSQETTTLPASLLHECTDFAPVGAPDLFQIDTTDTTATLYFAPASGPVDSYVISYGYVGMEALFGTQFFMGYTSGSISYTVNYLSPDTSYFFRVTAVNGCMPGVWSRVMEVKTNGTKFFAY